MAITDLSPTKRTEEQIFHEVKHHADIGFDETDRRSTGTGRVGSISFDEADELFRSYIDEGKWPYDALLFDPRVFTFIFEKTSRLIANKPKAKLIPREGADTLSAKINNALLDYQWDMATNGGSMLAKWALMDINTRKYGAAFALTKWRYEIDKRGKPLFDGPEMEVLNNRDIAHDLTATSIENCNWIQVRQYVTFQELERVNDYARAKPVYKNLATLRQAIGSDSTTGNGGDSRAVNWISRNRQISHLETDPMGKDIVFKTVEIITEYRRDRWITFAPKHGVVLRDIENPYQNNELPVVMLRYLAIDDDLYGLSEIEPIKGLQKAINALLCQYVDEINQNLYSPIAIGPGVRQHTLEWGKGARWIMNNPMTDFRLVESRSNAAQFFNNTYSVLVSAMMNALGESSLGVSNIQPYQNDKTATEVKALQLQRNARDNYNQLMLAESMKRQLMLWHTMNQLLLFSDPEKQSYIIRIVGKDAIKYFQNQGMDQMQIPQEANDLMSAQSDISYGGDMSQLANNGILPDQHLMPKFPVNIGSKEKPKLVPKLNIEGTDGATIYVEPEDIKGQYDFSIDVESMTVTADEERRQARQTAVSLLVSNPNILALLQQEGIRPKFKELFITWLEDLGFNDAEKFFENAQVQQGTPGQSGSPDQMGEMAKMLGGGGPGAGGAPGQVNEGTGANQMSKIIPPTEQQPTPEQTISEPNPTMYNKLVNKYGTGE